MWLRSGEFDVEREAGMKIRWMQDRLGVENETKAAMMVGRAIDVLLLDVGEMEVGCVCVWEERERESQRERKNEKLPLLAHLRATLCVKGHRLHDHARPLCQALGSCGAGV